MRNAGEKLMPDPSVAPPDDIPTHPEEMKTTFNLRVGNSISLQGSARITPAGVVTVGLTTLLVALAFVSLAPRRRRFF